MLTLNKCTHCIELLLIYDNAVYWKGVETIPNHVKQIFLCLKYNAMILGFPELELNFTKSVLYLK